MPRELLRYICSVFCRCGRVKEEKEMKSERKIRAALVAAAVCLSAACSKTGPEDSGILKLRFPDRMAGVLSRAGETEIPDTNDFILEIIAPDGTAVYSGLYGHAPEKVSVPAGSCNVSIRSCEFTRPQFSCPQYGDDQCVVVPAGGEVSVSLNCVQVNSGVKLNVDSAFLTEYPSAALLLKSADGTLPYSYSERRAAYFKPGDISLMMSENGTDKILMTRTLAAREILEINVKVNPSPSPSGGGISVQIDTSRFRNSEDWTLGGENVAGTLPETAMSVSQARSAAGAKKVWVKGYIVGGDLSSSSSGISFGAPFKSATNIAIADRASVTAKSSCMAVQLPAGAVRDAVNLADNPGLLGTQVILLGDVSEAYFGITGLKNVTDYVLK